MPCPICNRPVSADHRPFCSRRCADVDLGRWLTGSYRIPDDETSDDESAPGEGGGDRSDDAP